MPYSPNALTISSLYLPKRLFIATSTNPPVDKAYNPNIVNN
jgi:hypothetical protein